MRLEVSTKLVDSVVEGERRIDTSFSLLKGGELVVTQASAAAVAVKRDTVDFRCQGVILSVRQARALRWYLGLYLPPQRALPEATDAD